MRLSAIFDREVKEFSLEINDEDYKAYPFTGVRDPFEVNWDLPTELHGKVILNKTAILDEESPLNHWSQF